LATINNDQLRRLRGELDWRYDQLLEEVRREMQDSDDATFKGLAGEVSDNGDLSVADMLTDLNAALFDRQIQELRDIDAARLRMAEKSYGFCIDCGQPIEFERLQANPTAVRCYRDQERHDHEFATRSTPRM
jgi:RNA polymerase-binding protein DksA